VIGYGDLDYMRGDRPGGWPVPELISSPADQRLLLVRAGAAPSCRAGVGTHRRDDARTGGKPCAKPPRLTYGRGKSHRWWWQGARALGRAWGTRPKAMGEGDTNG